MSNTYFADAITAICENDVTGFEKLIKQQPQLLDVRTKGRSLLTFAVLHDRLRIAQFLGKRGLQFSDGDDNGDTAVHWATVGDARKSIKYILSLPRAAGEMQWILLKDRHDITPIHLAAKLGRTKILKMFTAAVTDYDNFYQCVDRIGQSPLHYAASCARVDCCEILLDERLGLPIDQKDNNRHTPLMCAAASSYPGAEDCVRLLGRRKSFSVTARNNRGRTALHLAIMSCNSTVVDVMLNELGCTPETFDNDARTPLHYAAQRGQLEIVEKLLAGNARNATRDCFGVSPAHYAAQGGYLRVVSRILASAGGTDQYDSDGRSCFMWAVIADQDEMVRHFLANFEPDRTYHDKYGYTALHHAAQVGSLRLVKLLVKEGWNIHDVDHASATPLHLAAGKGYTDVVRLLIMVGANSEQRDCQGRTPIFYACLGGQAHTLKVMISELNCKANHTDKLGRTALHCAAFAGFTACIEVILGESDCPIYKEDVDQLTALHIACERGKYDCVKHLLQCGAAVNALSKIEDVTPLSCAQINGHQQIADFLLRNGGLFPNQLRNLAAVIIQKWWKQLHNRNRKQRRRFVIRGPSPPRHSVIRKPRIVQA
uniref:Inversin n=2 Tax=Parascaris univalens TaxID=6257 RepID=A0A915B4I0_PARUN